MLPQERFQQIFLYEFEKLIKTICKRKRWDIRTILDIFKNGFKVNGIRHIEPECQEEVCRGMATTNNVSRRCSRTKKYGDLCGLHYNKELRDGFIQRYTPNIPIQSEDNIFYIKYNNVTESSEYINTMNKDFDMNDVYNEIDSDEEKIIIWGGRELKLDCRTNIVYSDGFNSDIQIGIYDQQSNSIESVY